MQQSSTPVVQQWIVCNIETLNICEFKSLPFAYNGTRCFELLTWTVWAQHGARFNHSQDNQSAFTWLLISPSQNHEVTAYVFMSTWLFNSDTCLITHWLVFVFPLVQQSLKDVTSSTFYGLKHLLILVQWHVTTACFPLNVFFSIHYKVCESLSAHFIRPLWCNVLSVYRLFHILNQPASI